MQRVSTGVCGGGVRGSVGGGGELGTQPSREDANMAALAADAQNRNFFFYELLVSRQISRSSKRELLREGGGVGC